MQLCEFQITWKLTETCKVICRYIFATDYRHFSLFWTPYFHCHITLIYFCALCSSYFVGVDLISQTRMCISFEDSYYYIKCSTVYFSKILCKFLFTFSNCRFSKQALKHIIITIRINSQSEYVIAAMLLRIPISQKWPSCISQQMQTWQKWFIPLCNLPFFLSHFKSKATEISKACYLLSDDSTYQIGNTIIKPVCTFILIVIHMYNLRYCFL